MPFYEAYGQTWGAALVFLLRRYQHFLGEVDRLANANRTLQVKKDELENLFRLTSRELDKRRVQVDELQKTVEKQNAEIEKLKAEVANEKVQYTLFQSF